MQLPQPTVLLHSCRRSVLPATSKAQPRVRSRCEQPGLQSNCKTNLACSTPQCCRSSRCEHLCDCCYSAFLSMIVDLCQRWDRVYDTLLVVNNTAASESESCRRLFAESQSVESFIVGGEKCGVQLHDALLLCAAFSLSSIECWLEDILRPTPTEISNRKLQT
jgi:hypothetical protein